MRGVTFPAAVSIPDIANNLIAETIGIFFTVVILAWLLSYLERRRWRTAQHFLVESVVKATNLIGSVIAENASVDIPEFHFRIGVPAPTAQEASQILIERWDEWFTQHDSRLLSEQDLRWTEKEWQSCRDAFDRAQNYLWNVMSATGDRLGSDVVGGILRLLEALDKFETAYRVIREMQSHPSADPLSSLGEMMGRSSGIPEILQHTLSVKRDLRRLI